MFKARPLAPRGPITYCCVPFCRSSKNKRQPGIFFHEFPSDTVTRHKWLKAVARENVCPKGASATSVVCCLHFAADDYVDATCSKLRPGAVPTIFPGREPSESLPEQQVTNGKLIYKKADILREPETGSSSTAMKKEEQQQMAVKSSRKRIKKTHGPDFLENLDSPTMEATEFFEDDEPHCFICCLTAASNVTGDVEPLLVCRDCSTKAHPSCLNYSPELVNVAQLSSWQCIDCKTCAVCNTNTDSDDLLVCDNCDKGYHPTCHKPKIANKPIGKWFCKACLEAGKKSSGPKVKMEVDPPAGLPTPCDSPVPEDELKDSDEEPHLDLAAYFTALDQYPDTIPDAKCWSIDEVEKFLVHVGFPEQASAFREQEIDGRSLLLLKRSDVLTGLSIKLGPALKIYNHIKRLQTGLPNGHLY
ncbi:uncharacterized protein LOC115323459 isoform X2 [Ixodes scapularis]|nr:uncharacterized protein LOC115323459 isoform X2 [Ixodes scapularis]